jgi:hypothetical protein
VSTGATVILWLHLLAALAFVLSVLYDLSRRLGRKLYVVWSDCLDGAAREVR